VSKQLDFFEIVESTPNQVEIKSYQAGDQFYAEIEGGWWIAAGPTRKAAISAVIKRYQNENE